MNQYELTKTQIDNTKKEIIKSKKELERLRATFGNTKIKEVQTDIVKDAKAKASEFKNLKDFDKIIHAAGKAHSVPRDLAEEKEFFRVNVGAIDQALQAIELALSGN